MKKLLFVALLAILPTALFAQNREQMIGCWVMSSRPGESLQLFRDGSIVFRDWNAKKSSFEVLTGTWKMQKSAKGNWLVTLYYDDRTKQTFTVLPTGKQQWALTKAGGFRFTKAQPGDCQEDLYND